MGTRDGGGDIRRRLGQRAREEREEEKGRRREERKRRQDQEDQEQVEPRVKRTKRKQEDPEPEDDQISESLVLTRKMKPARRKDEFLSNVEGETIHHAIQRGGAG